MRVRWVALSDLTRFVYHISIEPNDGNLRLQVSKCLVKLRDAFGMHLIVISEEPDPGLNRESDTSIPVSSEGCIPEVRIKAVVDQSSVIEIVTNPSDSIWPSIVSDVQREPLVCLCADGF